MCFSQRSQKPVTHIGQQSLVLQQIVSRQALQAVGWEEWGGRVTWRARLRVTQAGARGRQGWGGRAASAARPHEHTDRKLQPTGRPFNCGNQPLTFFSRNATKASSRGKNTVARSRFLDSSAAMLGSAAVEREGRQWRSVLDQTQ